MMVKNMGKRLTEEEKTKRTVAKILKRIKTIENDYGMPLTKRACAKYAKQKSDETKVQKEIKQRERELQALKEAAQRAGF